MPIINQAHHSSLSEPHTDPADLCEYGFTSSDHAMMLTLNSEAPIVLGTFGRFDDFKFDRTVNLSHARFVWAAVAGNHDALKSQIENGMPDRIKTLALLEPLTPLQLSEQHCSAEMVELLREYIKR